MYYPILPVIKSGALALTITNNYKNLTNKLHQSVCMMFHEVAHEMEFKNPDHFDYSIYLRTATEDMKQPLKGKLTGKVPSWLNGTLIRNGPGATTVGQYEFKHLFDCPALLHSFKILNGEVTYQHKFLESDAYKQNLSKQRIVFSEFGSVSVPDPCRTIFQRFLSVFDDDNSDNAAISIYPFGDEIYALGESPSIFKVNPDNLSTEAEVNLKEQLAIVHHTSHPHVTPSGDVYNLAKTVNRKDVGVANAIIHFPCKKDDSSRSMFEEARIVAEVSSRWSLYPPYMHTFGITDNYFILVEHPLTLSLPSMFLTKVTNSTIGDCFKAFSKEMVCFTLVSRKTGSISHRFFSETFFYFHIINQYELDNYLVIDICTYQEAGQLESLYIETLKNAQQNPNFSKIMHSTPVRFVLPLKPSSTEPGKELISLCGSKAQAYYLPDGKIFVKSEILCEPMCEMPRIHYEKYSGKNDNLFPVAGKPYRFFYGISIDFGAKYSNAIIKVDTLTKQMKYWHEDNCYESEPIFVPRPDGKDEDDGVVLTSLLWGGEDTNRTALLILNAKSFEEIAKVEFDTLAPVPKCFHGWFSPQK